MIDALADPDRALWATAMYAGLRRGELMALRWEDIDLAGGVIRIERSYDPKEQRFIEPKSKAGTRTVPIATVLRSYLVSHKLRAQWSEGLVFGRAVSTPFDGSRLVGRARTKWKKAKLAPITLHESRHTFASLMIAAP